MPTLIMGIEYCLVRAESGAKDIELRLDPGNVMVMCRRVKVRALRSKHEEDLI